MTRALFHTAAGLVWAVLLGASGCAVGPDFTPPLPPAADGYAESPLPPQTAAPGAVEAVNHPANAHPSLAAAQRFTEGDVSAEWWKLFGSPAINGLVERALKASPTLAQARAALERARELWRAESGAVWVPAADITASLTPQQSSTSSMGTPSAMARPDPFTVYAAGLSASYVFDIFGGKRRGLEALAAEADYRRHELEAARLTLVAEILLSCVREAGLRARICHTRHMLGARERQWRAGEKQRRAGGLSVAEAAVRKRELAEITATLPPLEHTLAANRHQLAVLAGAAPATAGLPQFHLRDFTLPDEIPLRLPGKQVRRRPDVRAAEALLHKSTAQYGAAVARLYPSLSLTAGVGYSATERSELFLDSANVWNVGLSLLQPLFRGGELRARKRAAAAEMDMALAVWRQTVLQGYADTANALAALHYSAETLAAAGDAANEASTVCRTARRQHALGGVSLVSLLDAERKFHELSLGHVQARADRLSQTVILFQALGGSWLKNSEPGQPEAETP